MRSYAINETEGDCPAAKTRTQSFLKKPFINANAPAAIPSTIAAHKRHLRERFGGGGATGPPFGGAGSFCGGAGSGSGGGLDAVASETACPTITGNSL